MIFQGGPQDGEEWGETGTTPATEWGDSAEQAAQAQTVRLQVRLTPAASVPGFHARVSGGRLGAPVEFSDAAFVRFLERIAERGPGLK
ncbi:hypothetical protein Q0M94_05635 [Deinococcus radiomollis]|uniref:hypothetical protein n=1 Tax=Deinococcus radiomollis TaxID=468916 RepID=UPI003891B8F3